MSQPIELQACSATLKFQKVVGGEKKKAICDTKSKAEKLLLKTHCRQNQTQHTLSYQSSFVSFSISAEKVAIPLGRKLLEVAQLAAVSSVLL